MNLIDNDISLIVLLAGASLIPFLIASGTCYLKFSVVFTLVRNGLGLQQVPSNMVINAIALMLAFYVMQPIFASTYDAWEALPSPPRTVAEIVAFLDDGLHDYKAYLYQHADKDLVTFFERTRTVEGLLPSPAMSASEHSIAALFPAYALGELKDAFRIGFYLYLPFVVIDLVVSAILLALGMMMMSPVTISAPIKLILFVAMDGWAMLSEGLVRQYMDVAT